MAKTAALRTAEQFLSRPFRLMCMLCSRAPQDSLPVPIYPTCSPPASCCQSNKFAYISQTLYMLKICSLHVFVAVRPHAGGVLGRRSDASRIQAGLYIRPLLGKCCSTDADGQTKASYVTESGLANVLTVALSLAILLCDTLPSPARAIEASSASQRGALYGELPPLIHMCSA